MELYGSGPSALVNMQITNMDATNPSPSNRLLALATGQVPTNNLDAHLVASTPTAPSVTYQADGGSGSKGAGSIINTTA